MNVLRAGQQMMMTQTLRGSGVTPIPDYAAFANQALIQIAGAGGQALLMLPCCPTEVDFVSHSLQPVSPLRLAKITRNFVDGTSGTLAGIALPPNTAITVTKRSANAGRFAVGSLHIPGGSVPQTTPSGLWTPGFLTTVQTLATKWAANWYDYDEFETLRPILWSRTVPNRFTPVTLMFPQATIRVERRRTVGLGV